MEMPKIRQSENQVKQAIKEYLEFDGYEVYRINNGGTKRKDKNGKEFYTFAGTPGVFDLYCVRPRHSDMWIESKATGKKPSEDQIKFMKLVNSVPGRYAFWCDSFDMFLPIYNDIKNGYGLSKQ
ncbi:MAG: VRR-NUC domain-containing protein [Candidatus Kuenenia sp.]|nr:VRR-NUC domain-containing protein [Candidatus Kuenenia sp.]